MAVPVKREVRIEGTAYIVEIRTGVQAGVDAPYVVNVPAMPDIQTTGATRKEAVQRAVDAISTAVQIAQSAQDVDEPGRIIGEVRNEPVQDEPGFEQPIASGVAAGQAASSTVPGWTEPGRDDDDD